MLKLLHIISIGATIATGRIETVFNIYYQVKKNKKYIRTWFNSWINWRLIQSVYFFCGMWAVKGNWVQTSCEINLRTVWIWITVWMVKCILIAKWSVIQMVIWKLDYFSQLLECWKLAAAVLEATISYSKLEELKIKWNNRLIYSRDAQVDKELPCLKWREIKVSLYLMEYTNSGAVEFLTSYSYRKVSIKCRQGPVKI